MWTRSCGASAAYVLACPAALRMCAYVCSLSASANLLLLCSSARLHLPSQKLACNHAPGAQLVPLMRAFLTACSGTLRLSAALRIRCAWCQWWAAS